MDTTLDAHMNMTVFDKKKILIAGGTGSLGYVLLEKLLKGVYGNPEKITIFSRDEAKQHYMRVAYSTHTSPTDEIIYNDFKNTVNFIIGDVRDYKSVCGAMRDVDIVINAAAFKQVPSCEYFVHEACMTNIIGAHNIVNAIRLEGYPVETVVGISTDKACLPINVMGMTKAVQERVFTVANLNSPRTRFICVRYGNVLASRGSVIPLFKEQIRTGGPVTITTPDMTRFLLPLSYAVTTIARAIQEARPGEIYVPKIKAARIIDIARALIGDKKIEISTIGIRPGEKIHEMMISPEEGVRTMERGGFFVISPMLPELAALIPEESYGKAYGSNDSVMTLEETVKFLDSFGLLDDKNSANGESSELLA